MVLFTHTKKRDVDFTNTMHSQSSMSIIHIVSNIKNTVTNRPFTPTYILHFGNHPSIHLIQYSTDITNPHHVNDPKVTVSMSVTSFIKYLVDSVSYNWNCHQCGSDNVANGHPAQCASCSHFHCWKCENIIH